MKLNSQTNPMLKIEIKKKKFVFLNDLSQLGLTHQTHNIYHETGMTLYKLKQKPI
jgi:hypothetical protein